MRVSFSTSAKRRPWRSWANCCASGIVGLSCSDVQNLHLQLLYVKRVDVARHHPRQRPLFPMISRLADLAPTGGASVGNGDTRSVRPSALLCRRITHAWQGADAADG